tara:strand:+ start:2519 stop:2965 length:447 start_codon:yes stop_codon:yes gene_type:complete
MSMMNTESFEDEMWTEAKELASEIKSNPILITDSERDITTMIWMRLALSERGRAYKLRGVHKELKKDARLFWLRKKSFILPDPLEDEETIEHEECKCGVQREWPCCCKHIVPNMNHKLICNHGTEDRFDPIVRSFEKYAGKLNNVITV